jgi:hypothetical protein
MAASMSSSETSVAPPSTMVIAVLVPATTISSSLFANLVEGGVDQELPARTLAILTAAMGPAKGMSEMGTAALAAKRLSRRGCSPGPPI